MSRGASAMPITAGRRAVDGDQDRGAAAGGQLVPAAAQRRRGRRPRASSRRRLPTATRWPSTVGDGAVAGRRSRSRSARSASSAAVVGVADDRLGQRVLGLALDRGGQRAAARSSSMPSATTSVTSGSPLVRVPVLSITTVSIRAEVSSAVAFLNSTPRWAPSPVPTMIAVGVARPRASGQVMTTTVIANSIAVGDRPAPTSEPGQRRCAAPPTSATSTSQNAARSASRCPGALEFCACWTSATIWASAVSAPTLVARTRSVPLVLIGGADDRGAGRLVHRQALAGDHRLVDLGLAVLDDAVDRRSSRRAGPAAGRRRRPRRWGPRPARRRGAPPPWAGRGRAGCGWRRWRRRGRASRTSARAARTRSARWRPRRTPRRRRSG